MSAAPATEQPLFQTASLRLRTMEPEDVPRLQEILNHPDLAGRRYLPEGFLEEGPLSIAQVERVLKEWGESKEAFHFGIIDIDSEALIGTAACDWSWDPHAPGVSLVLEPAQQRKGLGSQVLGTLLRYLYDTTPAHNVSCWIADWNQPALAFAAKHGFQEAGRVRHAGLRGGSTYDYLVLDLLRPEWLARAEA